MCFFNLVCILYDLPSLSYFDLILTHYHKIMKNYHKIKSQFFMQIKICQSRQFKYLNVYVVKDDISWVTIVFPTIMQHLVVKKIMLLFPDTRWPQLVFQDSPQPIAGGGGGGGLQL